MAFRSVELWILAVLTLVIKGNRDPGPRPSARRSGPVHYESQVTPVFDRYLYQPVIRAVEWLADVIGGPLQSGDVTLYLSYVFAVVLLAYILPPSSPRPTDSFRLVSSRRSAA